MAVISNGEGISAHATKLTTHLYFFEVHGYRMADNKIIESGTPI